MHSQRLRNSQASAHVDNLLAEVEAQMAEERARKEEMERLRREEEAKRREAEEQARREAEERARREQAERKRREEEERAKQEALERERLAEMERIRQEEMDRAIQEVEARLRREMEEQLRREREAQACREEEELHKRLAEKAALQKSYLEAIQLAQERGRKEAERRLRDEFAQLSDGPDSSLEVQEPKSKPLASTESTPERLTSLESTSDGSMTTDESKKDEGQVFDEHAGKHEGALDESGAANQSLCENKEASAAPDEAGQSGDKAIEKACLTDSEGQKGSDKKTGDTDDSEDDQLIGAKYLPKSAAARMAAMLEKSAQKPVNQTQVALTKKLLFKDEDPRKAERKRLVRTLGQSGRLSPLNHDGAAPVDDDQPSLADTNFELPKTKGSAGPQKIDTLKRKGSKDMNLVEDGEVTSSVSATSSFVKKRRVIPKRAKAGVIAGMVGLALLVSAVLFWSFTHQGWFSQSDNSQKPAAGTTVQFEVTTDSGWRLVAMDLRAQGLINDPSELIDAVKSLGLEQELKPGVFNLTVGQTPDEIAQILSHESNSLVHIPEGLTVRQTAEVIAGKSSISVEDFMAQAKASNYVNDFPFLQNAYDDSLEGYLFPKSYNLIPGSTADSVIRMMLKQYAEETKDLTYDAVESRGLAPRDIVTIASLIERETARDDERARIASVIYNRLDIKMKLQLCPTVIYALGGKTDPLTYEDLKVDSPYNTYLIDALPPGPICSPSLKSLQAAAHPETTDYLFYVSKGDGSHLFTKDYGQFEEGKEEYWNMQGRN